MAALFARLTRYIQVPTTSGTQSGNIVMHTETEQASTELGGKQTVDLLCVYFCLLFHMQCFEKGRTCPVRRTQHTTNSGEQSTFVKLIVAQLVKQFVALYGT
jgi:hypothetical protein